MRRLDLQWKLFIKETANNSSWRRIEDLQSKLLVSMHSKYFVLSANTLEGGATYKIQFSARAQNGSEGFADRIVEINSPPKGGRCLAGRATGFALEPTFSFSCSDWKDDDDEDSLMYKFSYRLDPREVEFLIQHGSDATAQNVRLPVGKPENNYTVALRVEIQDLLGAWTVRNLEVQVRITAYYNLYVRIANDSTGIPADWVTLLK